eukprot:scaffold139907_cov28-Tisochrysis_lutea.AAC.1
MADGLMARWWGEEGGRRGRVGRRRPGKAYELRYHSCCTLLLLLLRTGQAKSMSVWCPRTGQAKSQVAVLPGPHAAGHQARCVVRSEEGPGLAARGAGAPAAPHSRGQPGFAQGAAGRHAPPAQHALQ